MTDTIQDEPNILRAPSAWIPFALAGCAILLLTGYLLTGPHQPYVVIENGVARPDEGVVARTWQLLMLSQVPAMAWFALRWVPRRPKPAAVVLGFQLLAFAAAALPVYLLEM